MQTEPASDQKISQAVPSPTATRLSCWSALRRWILLAGFAYIAMTGIVRLVTTILNWYWLDFARLSPGPLYLAITGGFWGIVALTALAWILLRRSWFRLVGFSAALFFAITYWIDRLFISALPGGAGNTAFAILLTLLLLAYAFFILRPLLEIRAFKSK